MNNDQLLALADRCEAIDGPDPALDAEIGALPAAAFLGFAVGKQPGCQAYTGSLDAALTLVNRNWWPQIRRLEDGGWRVFIGIRTPGQGAVGGGATMALAVTAAALRAMTQERRDAAESRTIPELAAGEAAKAKAFQGDGRGAR